MYILKLINLYVFVNIFILCIYLVHYVKYSVFDWYFFYLFTNHKNSNKPATK
jgi:hypothetical protein